MSHFLQWTSSWFCHNCKKKKKKKTHANTCTKTLVWFHFNWKYIDLERFLTWPLLSCAIDDEMTWKMRDKETGNDSEKTQKQSETETTDSWECYSYFITFLHIDQFFFFYNLPFLLSFFLLHILFLVSIISFYLSVFVSVVQIFCEMSHKIFPIKTRRDFYKCVFLWVGW